MKRLMQRRDGPAMRDTVVWIFLHVALAAGGIYFWGSWFCIPFWLSYGVLYGSACDSRWHECGHGTAFRTRWMNDVVYQIASFQVVRNPVNWRWSHARHHTDTIIVGRDPEIAWMHPIRLAIKALAYVGLHGVWQSFVVLARNATGNLSPDEKDYIPESEQLNAIFWARLHMTIYAVTALVASAMLISCSSAPASRPLTRAASRLTRWSSRPIQSTEFGVTRGTSVKPSGGCSKKLLPALVSFPTTGPA